MSDDHGQGSNGDGEETAETIGEVAEGVGKLGETVSKAAEGDVAGAVGSGLGALGAAGELAGGALGEAESGARDAVNTASTVASTAGTVVNTGRSLLGAAQSGDAGKAAGALGSASDAARYIVPEGEARDALSGVGSVADALGGDGALEELGGMFGGAGRNPVEFHLEVAGLEGQWGITAVSLQEGLNVVPNAQVKARYAGHPERSDLKLAEAKLTIERGEHIREFKGLVFHARVKEGDEDSEVTLRIAPAATYLAHKVNNKIHQNVTVVEAIVETYKGMLGPLQRSVDESLLQRSYETREYIVQYQESNLSFLSRLAEEEGIFWFFEHDGEKEVLVLADTVGNLPQARAGDQGQAPYHPDPRQAPDGESIFEVESDEAFGATDMVVRGWDWTNPTLDVVGERTGRGDSDPATEVYDHTDALILHDYSGGQYQGNTAETQAQLRAERLDLDRQHWSMSATVVSAVPGRTLEVVGSPGDFDKRYLIVSMTSHGSATEGVSGTWTSSIEVVPTELPYRPPHRTPRPVVHGPETAIVVGPDGSEIHTDEHGRVKVRFHWDRDHAPRENDSSCWIRVSHNWAGPGFGTFFLPRVDMEVVVSFLGGNPDRPIVTGCVYHGTNRAGVELDAKKTQSLIRTKSSPNSEGFNEMRFEDEAGNEFIYVHAQKDYNEEVENNHSTHVKANQTNTVDVDQTETIHGEQTMTVDKNRTVTVTGSQSFKIEGSEANDGITGSKLDITGDYQVDVSDWIKVTAPTYIELNCGESKIRMEPGKITFHAGQGAEIVLDANAKTTSNAGTEQLLDADARTTASTGAELKLTSDADLKSIAGSRVLLDVSALMTSSKAAVVELNADANMSGDNAQVAGRQTAEVTAPTATLAGAGGSVEAAASGVDVAGPTVNVSGQSMVNVSGSVVKIN